MTKSKQQSLIYEELEPRLLFSAGLEGVLLDDIQVDSDTAILETVTDAEAEVLLSSSSQATHEPNQVHEVIFISENAENFDQLIEELADQDNIDVYILDDSQDGVAQITSVLSTYQDLTAVHLVAEGNTDGLQLGSGSLAADSLANYSSDIESWQSALGDDASLTLYGSDLENRAEGQALMSGLQQLTGVGVAASETASS